MAEYVVAADLYDAASESEVINLANDAASKTLTSQGTAAVAAAMTAATYAIWGAYKPRFSSDTTLDPATYVYATNLFPGIRTDTAVYAVDWLRHRRKQKTIGDNHWTLKKARRVLNGGAEIT